MKRSLPSSRRRAFTLTEVLIASTVSLIMFGAVCAATVFLQRSYATSMDYMIGTEDQQRAMDYIARDLRRAYSVTVSQSNQTLTVTVPDAYASYDSNGNPVGPLVTPSITGATVNYNDPTKLITISYYVNNGQLMRQQTIGKTGAVSTFVVTNGSRVQNLQSQFANLTSIVNYTVTFTPDSHLSGSSGPSVATTLTSSTSVRNALR